MTKQLVESALQEIKTPDGVPLSDLVRTIAVCEGHVGITLDLSVPADLERVLKEAANGAIRQKAEQEEQDIASVRIQFAPPPSPAPPSHAPPSPAPPSPAPSPKDHTEKPTPTTSSPKNPQRSPQEDASALPGVKCAIAIGAGKGGVGKSTVAVNLAVALARRGHAVGLLDGDIYGPSLPTMLGLDTFEPNVVGGMLQPFAVHGIKASTIGKLVEPDKALIWRGPMAHGAFKQLAEQTQWGELDYLIIDLPPGTGDVPLTMAQVLRLTGAVVICTPQKVAQDDAVRAVKMFGQLGIEVIGIIENMSYFIGDDGKEYDIFGRGGAEQMAQRLGVPFLGAVPITMALRQNSDSGDPTANFKEGTNLARDLESLATNFEGQVALATMKLGQSSPTLTIS